MWPACCCLPLPTPLLLQVPELSPFLLWVIAGIPLATTTILILAIDLGTDMIPAISFAYEVKEADIMARAPRNANTDHLVTLKLLLFTYLHIGVMQVGVGVFGGGGAHGPVGPRRALHMKA